MNRQLLDETRFVPWWSTQDFDMLFVLYQGRGHLNLYDGGIHREIYRTENDKGKIESCLPVLTMHVCFSNFTFFYIHCPSTRDLSIPFNRHFDLDRLVVVVVFLCLCVCKVRKKTR